MVTKLKRCPRCGETFQCLAMDIASCQCQTVVLTPAQRDEIKQRYDGCLCRTCLVALAESKKLG